MDFATVTNYIATTWLYTFLFYFAMAGMCVTSILTAYAKVIYKRAIGYTGTLLFFGIWIFLFYIYPVGII